jgi:hypothetical protein
MAKAKLQTTPTRKSVAGFLATVDKARQQDCQAIVELMREAARAEPEMWGPSIVGFGRYQYKYESGREGEWMVTGFSPRKNDLTLYIMPGVEAFPDLLPKLGKFKNGKSCLYIKKLADVDLGVLRQLIGRSVARIADKRVDSRP